MPSGPRIRANNVYGVISDNPLAPGAATFNSISLPLLPPVVSAHAVVVFDPKRVYGDPEIVVVTAHTASSTVATILRGQYGTSTREHPQGTAWAHVPVDEDWIENVALSSEISDPYRGQMLFDRTLDRYLARSTADAWVNVNMLADPPACRVTHSVSQNHTSAGNWQALAFDTESFDTGGMHDTVTNNSRITITVPGLYVIHGSVEVQATTGVAAIGVRKNGTGVNPPTFSIQGHVDGAAQALYASFSDTVKLAANDWIELVLLQPSASVAVLASVTEGRPNFSAVWVGRGI